ncbi:MAG: chemotaxis protein CheW [Pseudomonadota bacterium]
MSASQAPLDILLGYQARVLDIRAEIPVVQTAREEWAGLAFSLLGQLFVAPMSEVDEIVYTPDCTPVPNTRDWFLGIGNVRGNLIPISDLSCFVRGDIDDTRRNSRVLTCSNGDSMAGIVVDEILGLRRFYVDEQAALETQVPEALSAFVPYVYSRDAQEYPVFEINKFINSNEFLHIAR